MKKYLMVPLEIKTRELDARLFLSLKLISNYKNSCWEVIIGDRKEVRRHWSKGIDQPFILFSSGIVNQENVYKLIFKVGGRFVMLDEEGGVFAKIRVQKYPRGGFNHDCIKYVDCVFLWGVKEKENWLKRHKNLTEEKCVVAGNPRFDISKKKYSDYFRSISPSHNGMNNYILVNAAFGSGNPIVNKKKEALFWQRDKGHEKIRKKWKPIEHYQKKLLPLFIQGIAQLAITYNDQMFIVRPHPVEKEETYLAAFKSIPNIRIISKGAVQEWLPNARLMIHSGCTTAIEAFFAGLEPICYAPHIEEDCIQRLTFEVSEVVGKVEDLIDLVGKKLNGNCNYSDERRNKIKSIIKPHVDNIDYLSVDRIAENLEALPLNSTPLKDDSHGYNIKKVKRFNFTYGNILPKLYHKIRPNYTNSIRNEILERDKVKFPSLSMDEMKIRINAFRKVDPSLCSYNICQIDENTFRITKC